MKAKQFLVVSLSSTALLLATVAFVNIQVDPYALSKKAININDKRPRPSSDIDNIKLLKAISLKADCFIVGNSRADIGLDPQNAFFNDCHATFNLAVPGLGPESQAVALLKILESGAKLKKIVLSVDFFDFVHKANVQMEIDQNLKRFDSFSLAKFRFSSILTASALKDSWRTLGHQKGEKSASIRGDGLNTLEDYAQLVSSEGHFALFGQQAVWLVKLLSKSSESFTSEALANHPRWKAINQIIALAVKNDAQITIMTNPYHLQIHEIFRIQKVEKLHREFKSLLLENVANTCPTGSCAMLDFSQINQYSIEKIPSPKDTKTQMQWYWEGGHFKKELGDLMLTAAAIQAFRVNQAPKDQIKELVVPKDWEAVPFSSSDSGISESILKLYKDVNLKNSVKEKKS